MNAQKRNIQKISYTKITDTVTFVIAQHSPTRFETFRICEDADGSSVTLPKYFDTLKDAENHRNKFITLMARSN